MDFIRHGAGHGKTLREVLLEAGAVRIKPILLTALAAMNWGRNHSVGPALLWDGEWEITYVTFRDMSAAFGAALLAIMCWL